MKQKSMQEVFRENRLRMLNEDARRREALRKEQIKNRVLTAIIATFIILATITLLNNLYNENVAKCSQKHDINYCERVLA